VDAVTALALLGAGFVVATGLIVVAVVMTVRHQGWGRRSWAPHAVPWFVAAMIILAITLLGGIAWAVL